MMGRDLIISSKTGSGKTLSYLLPLITKLGEHSEDVGVRAIIILPTRELALQVASVMKKALYETNLRYSLLLGGHAFDG